MTRKLKYSPIIVVLSLFTTYVQANTQLSYYFDSRDFNTFAIQLWKNDIPANLSFWGFTELHSVQGNSNKRYDLSRSFSEYRLTYRGIEKWLMIQNIGLQLEYNDFTPGEDNSLFRGGVVYRFRPVRSQKHWLSVRFFPFQSNAHRHFSFSYSVAIYPGITLTGFADFDIQSGSKNQWVIEPQLNFSVYKRTWILLEYRYNGHERKDPTLDGRGAALGIKYKL